MGTGALLDLWSDRGCRRHGIRAVIPRRKDQRPDDKRHRFDRDTYQRRAVVEQCVGWLKENRRLATRYEKLAVSYLAVAHVCMIRLYLRRITGLSDRT